MSKCRSCGAPIFWAQTASGKRIPLDINKSDRGNLIVEDIDGDTVADYVDPGEGDYVSHFATCPQAGKWRRR